MFSKVNESRALVILCSKYFCNFILSWYINSSFLDGKDFKILAFNFVLSKMKLWWVFSQQSKRYLWAREASDTLFSACSWKFDSYLFLLCLSRYVIILSLACLFSLFWQFFSLADMGFFMIMYTAHCIHGSIKSCSVWDNVFAKSLQCYS